MIDVYGIKKGGFHKRELEGGPAIRKATDIIISPSGMIPATVKYKLNMHPRFSDFEKERQCNIFTYALWVEEVISPEEVKRLEKQAKKEAKRLGKQAKEELENVIRAAFYYIEKGQITGIGPRELKGDLLSAGLGLSGNKLTRLEKAAGKLKEDLVPFETALEFLKSIGIEFE
ncbi:MAG: hypothetical protein ABIE43_03455 [Patescibacteria group bacterium]